MKLTQKIKFWRMKRALRNNAGRIAVAAFAGLFVGIRTWRSMRAH